MKTCNRCHQEQPNSNFSFKKKDLGLRNDFCKTCHKEYVRKHYINNKDVYKARAKVSNVKLSEDRMKVVNDIKSNRGCYFCKENDFCCLDFHHIDGSTKEFDVGKRARNKSIKVVLKEIEKCEVLCANCHRKLHAGKLKYPHRDSNPEI